MSEPYDEGSYDKGSRDVGTVEPGGAIDRGLRERFGWTPYRVLAGAALFGCVAVLLADVVMWFLVEGYSPIGQTISELAAGPHHAVQDTGIVLFALGIVSLAVALILRGRSGARAWTVRLGFLALAGVVALIALRNEYGDGRPGGVEIHRYLVGALYVLVGALLWLGSAVRPAAEDRSARLGKPLAVAWALLAPLFYLVPDGVDGLYERALALFLVGCVGIAALRLWRNPATE